MKKMIRMAMMSAALFAVTTSVAQAQGGGGGRGRANPLTIVKDSLKVTDAGILAKVDSIVKAAAAESAPLMEAARGGDADARTKMTAVTTKRNDAIKALLTPEQKTEFDRLLPPGGRRGGGF
jgi:choline dehydrogenase-like flavoprotein